MNATANRPFFRFPRTTYAWVRQIHLWIGAWGALATIVYGFTGLLLNHRTGENPWPQGKTTPIGENVVQIPADARATPEALSLWLQQAQKLEVTMIRKGGPGGPGGKAPPRGEGRGEGGPRGETARGPGGGGERWTLSGGTPGNSWSMAYTPGSDSAEIKYTKSDFLAALNKLHKGIGGGWWVFLADTLAIGMLLLGISGIWMWAKGRSRRELLVSVMSIGTLVFAITIGLLSFG
ncbi:PepSY-associated TM helix domain-containing protein [Pseudoxanthomonas sangjuensis]|uniref:PepSY-associated TM helix domain-containing protein n=1 Tax=Pseudoxanthomonas sangjuensis TaxID=1503750 RepID=UPI00139137DD|nr:PepSY-associated TM helix domain-containing protein [Pseudoxanthomonas sangjuensis]